MSSFVERVKKFFEFTEEIAGTKIVVFRYDGLILYTSEEWSEDVSLGALMGGTWQAAKAMLDMTPSQDDRKNFRLSFDTSSSGIYILPIENSESEIFVAGIYASHVNPGYLKNRLRKMADSACKFLSEVSLVHKNKNEDTTSENNECMQSGEKKISSLNDRSIDRNCYLFNDLQDDEIDSLFATIEG